ncbi:MAG: hypothetical protein RLZZ293_909, partial [Pseudomonadota bacterium]
WQQFTAGAPTIIESANYQGIVNNYHLMMNAASVAALASDDAYAFYRAIEVVANGNESYNNFMQNFVNNTTFYTNSVSQYTNEKSYQRLIPLEDAAEIMREQPTAYNYILAPQVSNVILQCFSYQALVTNLTSNPTSAIENCQLAATNYAQYVIDTIGNSDINLPTDSSSLAVDGLNLSLNGIPTFNWDTSTPVKVGTNLLNQPMSDGIIFNGQTVAYNLPTTTSYTWGRTPSAQISNSLLNILNNDYSGMANLGLNQVVTNKSEANNIDTYNLALFSNGMKFESVALDFGNYQQNIWGQYNTNNLESTLPVIQKGQYLDPASWNGIQSVQLNLPYAVESGSKIPNLKSSSLTVSFASSMVYDLSPIINSLGGYDELPNNVLMSSSPDINSATMQSTANDNTIGIPVTCPMNINGRGSYASNNILVSNSPWTYPAMCSGGNIEAAPITTIQGMLSGTSQSEMFVVEKAKIDFNNYSVNLQPYQLSANNSLTCNYHVSNIVYDQLTQNITYQYKADSSCKIYGLMLVSGLSNYSDFVVQYPFLDYLAQITPAPLSITVPSNFTLMYNGISSTTVSDLKAKLNALSKDRIMQLKQLSIKK